MALIDTGATVSCLRDDYVKPDCVVYSAFVILKGANSENLKVKNSNILFI